MVGNRELVGAMARIQGQTTSCASILSQVAAEGALTGSPKPVEDLRLLIQNNRDVALEGLRSLDGVKCNVPGGTFYCMPDFRAYNEDSMALAEFLLKKALVVTVPGKPFGMEGHLRLSYAGAEEDVRQGIERIRWALDPDGPEEIVAGDRKLVRDW